MISGMQESRLSITYYTPILEPALKHDKSIVNKAQLSSKASLDALFYAVQQRNRLILNRMRSREAFFESYPAKERNLASSILCLFQLTIQSWRRCARGGASAVWDNSRAFCGYYMESGRGPVFPHCRVSGGVLFFCRFDYNKSKVLPVNPRGAWRIWCPTFCFNRRTTC